MTAATASPPRIVTLDVVRGVAVMGILAMNIVAFAMPQPAYENPLAYGGESALDLAAYAFNFVLVDGKMRGLFSFLFGASMLLVIERAEAAGRTDTSAVVPRQLWLLVFGAIHFYLIWYGDILIGYALIGLVAWGFRRHSAYLLVGIGIALVAAQLYYMVALADAAQALAAEVAAPIPDADVLRQWDEFTRDVAIPSAAELQRSLALYRGPWTGIVEYQLNERLTAPVWFILAYGWETLAFMLFGMAALKSGFLTGAWSEGAYAKVAIAGLGIGIAAYAVLVVLLFESGFHPAAIFTYAYAATVPFRPVMVAGYAALVMLLAREQGWLAQRIAAAGRSAFSNYLGTSLVMTALFYGWGFGLFGALGRAELWLVVIAAWIAMLAWSKPWLDRFAYGPFEWLWRSLSRWQLQPLRRRS